MQLKIEYLSENDLKPYVNNAKIHTDGQVKQIKKSIRDGKKLTYDEVFKDEHE